MATTNVSLPADMVAFVENEVAEGGYASPNEVIHEALQLLRHDKASKDETLAPLRREINTGLAGAAAARCSAKSVSDIADEVRREHSDPDATA